MDRLADALAAIANALAQRLELDITINIRSTRDAPAHPQPQPRVSAPTIPTPEPPTDRERDEAMSMLLAFGITEDSALELSREFTPDRIRQCVDAIRANPRVTHRQGYLVTALRNGYFRSGRGKKR